MKPMHEGLTDIKAIAEAPLAIHLDTKEQLQALQCRLYKIAEISKAALEPYNAYTLRNKPYEDGCTAPTNIAVSASQFCFGDIVPEGAGVLDSIVDMGDGLLEVNNSAVFYPGQRVSVYAKNWVLRGWVTIKEVSLVRTTKDKSVLIFDEPLPAGTCRGDRLVVEHADDFEGLSRH